MSKVPLLTSKPEAGRSGKHRGRQGVADPAQTQGGNASMDRQGPGLDGHLHGHD